MRKPSKTKMAGVNSRFASVSELIFNGFLLVDCEQSLFSSKIRGKERKTRKHASVTVSVT